MKAVRAGAIFLAMLVPAAAQGAEVPYDKKLQRLAELLGSIHYLRNMCGEESGAWRERMNALLETEAPSPARRKKLVASFNHGYRAFASTYTTCTPQAVAVVERYMREGAKLADEIALRYGD